MLHVQRGMIMEVVNADYAFLDGEDDCSASLTDVSTPPPSFQALSSMFIELVASTQNDEGPTR